MILLVLAGCGGGDGGERQATPTDWKFAPPMANRRSYVAAGEVAGRLYVAGGMFGDAGTRLDRVQVFDPKAGVWTTLPRLPEPVRAAAGATRDGEFLVLAACGGGDGDEQRATATDWKFAPPMANRRSYVAAGEVAGRLYVAGGMFGDAGTRLDRVQVFEPKAGVWTTLPRLPEPVRAAAGATRDGEFLVLGGTTPEGGGRQVFAYDVATRRWREAPPLPRVLYNHSAVTVGDRVYVLGGYDTEGAELRNVYVLDGARWRTSAPLPRPVHAFGAVVFRGEIWVIGGRRGEQKLREVWIFNPATNRWRPGPTLPKPMELLGAAVVGDEIHAVWEQTYQIYDAKTGRWRDGPPPLVPRHALSLFHLDGALYAVGGCTTKLRDTAVVETRPVR